MAVTDQDLLDELQEDLLEPPDLGVTWWSGNWTAAEVLTCLNEVQVDFLNRSQIVLTQTTSATHPNLVRQSLPATLVFPVRVVWQGVDGKYRQLPPASHQEADFALPTWPTDASPVNRPLAYTTGDVPRAELDLLPPVSLPGQLHVLGVFLPTELTGAGIDFTVPDAFIPYVWAGVLARLLQKLTQAENEGANAERAAALTAMYEEGIELAKLLLEAF